jgi:hypothetical protein
MIVAINLSGCNSSVEIIFCMSWNSFPYIWLDIVCNGVGGMTDEFKERAEEGSIGNYQRLWRGAHVCDAHALIVVLMF